MHVAAVYKSTVIGQLHRFEMSYGQTYKAKVMNFDAIDS